MAMSISSALNTGQELPPESPLSASCVAHAAGHFVNELLHVHAERNFVDPWFIDRGRKHRAVVAAIFRRAAIGVGFSALENDCRNRAQRFHIVVIVGSRRGPLRQEGRLNARIPALAFERFHQRRFLAALVSARAGMNQQVKIKIQSQEYFSPGSRARKLRQSPLPHVQYIAIFAADIDVSVMRIDGTAPR